MRNRRFISILLTLCMALSLLPTSALAAAEQYTDVKAGAWYYEDVDFVTDKGYFKGMSDTIFAPDETMTRAMFVTVLSRYAEAKVDDTTSTFTDVPAGTWYTGAVTWAAKKGIVEGRGNGIFDPNGTVTREEMCTILDRYLKAYDLDAKLAKKPATITDLETVSAWAVEAVEDCVAFGVIIGYPDGTFGPKITASRAHVAAILHRLQIIVDESDGPSTETYEAVYIGVKDFTELDTDETPEEEFVHLFYIDGDVEEFDIKDTEAFTLENKLRAGYIYTIKVRDDVVTSVAEAAVETGVAADFDLEDKDLYEIESPIAPSGAVVKEVDSIAADATVKVTENAVYKAFVAEDYTAPVIPTPGLKTLKNFLATALHPVGTALYVYGGAWDWQDDESSNQSITIGIPQEWIDTFQSQDTTYHYKKKDASGSHADSFYTSNRGWNQYYWAGVDCSAYVGWTVWNTLNTENGVQGKDGYVMSSTNQAYNFANLGWGTYDKGEYKLNGAGEIYADGDGDSHRLFDTADFNVGDVFSDNGHVWICLGVCEDGSMVFMHSTPSTSKDGLGEGGGIQISALDLQDRETCEAAELADYYMTTYYPQWAERYDAVTKGESYIKVYDTGMPGTDGYRFRKAGRFSWDLEDGILSDPDDYSKLTPAEILADIFAEEEEKDEPSAPSKPSTPSKPSKPEVEEPETPAEPEQPEQPEVPAEKPVFEDVPADHWAADAIEKVVEKGLFKGVEADKFAPSADITREQIMTVLARAAGADTEGDALAKGMAWAKENGISDGTNGKGKVTREQLVTMLYRVAVKNGMDVTVSGAALDFADAASISAFAQEAMQWAIENGIINGMSETTLAPQGPATRAQIAIIMVRFENL